MFIRRISNYFSQIISLSSKFIDFEKFTPFLVDRCLQESKSENSSDPYPLYGKLVNKIGFQLQPLKRMNVFNIINYWTNGVHYDSLMLNLNFSIFNFIRQKKTLTAFIKRKCELMVKFNFMLFRFLFTLRVALSKLIAIFQYFSLSEKAINRNK